MVEAKLAHVTSHPQSAQLLWAHHEEQDGCDHRARSLEADVGAAPSLLAQGTDGIRGQVVRAAAKEREAEGERRVEEPARDVVGRIAAGDGDEADSNGEVLVPFAPWVSLQGSHAVQRHEAEHGAVHHLADGRIHPVELALRLDDHRAAPDRQGVGEDRTNHARQQLRDPVAPDARPCHLARQAEGQGERRIQVAPRNVGGCVHAHHVREPYR
mmetsp:Transcript_22237/g.56639  ORF Transcript_22237/g.56639 Transcript_22237/m.56639 type:complete len:213 (-) Transcript_22237:345-983(-)